MSDPIAQCIAELRAKAEAARGTTLPLQVPANLTAEQEASLAFLKAASPSVVLTLLAVAEAAQKMRAARTSMDAALYGEHLDAALSNLARTP